MSHLSSTSKAGVRISVRHTAIGFLCLVFLTAGVPSPSELKGANEKGKPSLKPDASKDVKLPPMPIVGAPGVMTPEQDAWTKAAVCIIDGRTDDLEALLIDDPSLASLTINSVKSTLLHEASERGQVDCAKMLLKHGADPLAVTSKWSLDTPLHLAAKTDSVEVITVLLDGGVDINVLGGGPPAERRNLHYQYTFYSPLDIAATAGSAKAVELLLKRGAKLNVNPAESSYSALHRSMEGWYNLIGYGSLNRLTDPSTRAEKGNRKVIELLLEHGAKLDDRDFNGDTPFHIAVRRGSVETLEYLLESHSKSIDVNEPGQFGSTPLHLAVQDSHAMNRDDLIAVIKLLLKAGADKNKMGGPSFVPCTPFAYAKENGWDESTLELLRP